MFDALAPLANSRPLRVALAALVFFIAAGALGGSVAELLDPYGAECARQRPGGASSGSREDCALAPTWPR